MLVYQQFRDITNDRTLKIAYEPPSRYTLLKLTEHDNGWLIVCQFQSSKPVGVRRKQKQQPEINAGVNVEWLLEAETVHL